MIKHVNKRLNPLIRYLMRTALPKLIINDLRGAIVQIIEL